MIDFKYTDNRKVFNWHEGNGCDIPFLSFKMLDELGIPNLYTTRYQKYDTQKGTAEKGLRVAYMKGEDVAEARSVIRGNMSVLAKQLGSDIDHLRITKQEHTANVVALGEDDLSYETSVANTDPIDGIITNIPNACLVVYGADCPSIYLVDPVNKAVGLLHAGWKGTFGKISQVAIKMMQRKYGSDPTEMYAAIGPSICEEHYEMGDEIFDRLAAEWSRDDAEDLMKRHNSGKYHLDLWKANRTTLERAGIPADHIEVTNICTYTNQDDFYSYRAGKMENEQAAMVVCRFEKQ